MLTRTPASSPSFISEVHSQMKVIKSMAIATTATTSSFRINRAVISLDGILVGNVSEEENNNMIVTADNTRDKFIIPNCKVFLVDKGDTNNIVVDIVYHELVKYRVVE